MTTPEQREQRRHERALAQMTHVWVEYKPNRWTINGDPNCLVMPLDGQRWLWVHRKQSGHADTIERAKEWCETAREVWPQKLR